ncbi:MAG: exodeoxyribonuclease V subunit gamma [Balneolaceae bacterium]
MIYITESDRMECLAEAAALQLKERVSSDPVVGPLVLVPNRDTARWLSLELANRNGVAANITWQLPSQWLWNEIRNRNPDLAEYILSDPGPLTWLLFSLLGEHSILSRYPLLHHYLEAGGEENREKRRVWLSRHLASLYDQYLNYRPDMLVAWEKSVPEEVEERWQAELWREIVSRMNRTAKGTAVHRASLFNSFLREVNENKIVKRTPEMIFNPGRLSEPILQILSGVGKFSDFHLYRVTPGKIHETDNQNRLYQLFGEEFFRQDELLRKILAGNDFTRHVIDRGAAKREDSSLLHQLQDSVWHNQPVPDGVEPDQSLTIRSCHSPVREVEVLYQYVLEAVSGEHGFSQLRPDDILVVTPDIGRYAPAIRAVFGEPEEGLPHIPFNLDSTLNQEGSLTTLFQGLLKLADSRFSREDLFEWIRNEWVMQAFRFSKSDLQTIEYWFRENRVRSGIDADHRKEHGEPSREWRTWNSALRRGWMGQMTGGEPGDYVGEVLLYHRVSSRDDLLLWARFQKLFNLLVEFRDGSRRLRIITDWVAWLEEALANFLQSRLYETVESMKLLEHLETVRKEAEVGGMQESVPFEVIRATLLSESEGKEAGGLHFGRGIHFASMVPARSMPFRMIALLGLDDGVFPSSDPASPYDLIAAAPRPGERDRREEEKALFLESMMAAREVFYCSYSGMDRYDDRPHPPSSILSEWAEQVFGAGGTEATYLERQPLQRFSRSLYLMGEGISRLDMQVAEKLRVRSRGDSLIVIDKLPKAEDFDMESVRLQELCNFFRHPLRTFFQKRCGVRFDRSEDPEQEFDISSLEMFKIVKFLAGWRTRGVDSDQSLRWLQDSAIVPEGWPGERLSRDLIFSVNESLKVPVQLGHPVRQELLNISVELDGTLLAGEVSTMVQDGYFTVSRSSSVGRNLIPVWVTYLALLVSEAVPRGNGFLFELSKPNSKWRSFKEPENPEALLKSALQIYREGVINPLPIFPDPLCNYAEKLQKGESEEAARSAFIKTFYSEYGGMAEDPYVRLLFGEPENGELEIWSRIVEELIFPMQSAMEDLNA